MPFHSKTKKKQIFTIGHSTRSIDEFLEILKHYQIETLVDIRRFPKSVRNPHFSKKVLEEKLPANGIRYVWIEKLGGFRKGGYEEYIKTKDFQEGFKTLIEISRKSTTAVMCAELLWFRCHRRFIATALTEETWCVVHIYNKERKEIHRINEAKSL